MSSADRAPPTPARQIWLALAGLLAVFAGERIVSQVGLVHWVLTALGGALLLAATLLRWLAWRKAAGDARPLARLHLLTTAGCTLAIAGFLLAGDVGRLLGISSEGTSTRAQTVAVVLSSILLAVSLLTLLAAQWAAGVERRSGLETGTIDRLRVASVATAGATVALAGAFLLVVGYVTSAHDAMLDVGYFKTSSPGSAVTRITSSLRAPLRMLLFFPPASEVGDQVLGYFRTLAAASDNVSIEQHDRLASPALAQQYGVGEDGTIVFSMLDVVRRYTLPTSINQARPRLRELDGTVQQLLMGIARARRTVYMTVGHGELNDPTSSDPLREASYGGIDAFRSLFSLLNYGVSDLGVQNGLGLAVPADAAIVVLLGPRRPFLDVELQAIDNYLAGGGSALIALEPGTNFKLGPLAQRLGVVFHDVTLADDAEHLQQRGNISDRQLIVTDRFSSHESLATLGQAGVGSGIAMFGAGYFTTPEVRASTVIWSLASTFPDLNRDFEQEANEKRDTYPLVVAIEDSVRTTPTDGTAAADTGRTGGPAAAADTAQAAGSPEAAKPRTMRAMVFADADMFSDGVVTSLGLNAALVADAVRWLGHEEELSGVTNSENDVPVVHTRAQDVGWFYATIFGMPTLVLLVGLLSVRRRRRKSAPGRET